MTSPPSHLPRLLIAVQTQSRASTRSRIPHPGLREMNPATTNSRSGIPPPGSIANKGSVSRTDHNSKAPKKGVLMTVAATRSKPANDPEPNKSASVSRPIAGAPKAHTRGNSFASSTMSRIGSTASRSTNGTFSNTMGYSGRPASAMSRPNSALSARKLNGASIPRPATSLDTHAEDGASVLGKRKGMQIFPSSPSHFFSCPVGNPKEPHRSTSWSEARQRAPKEAPGGFADLSNSALRGDTLGLKAKPYFPYPKDLDTKASTLARPLRQPRVHIPSPTMSCIKPSLSPGPTPKKPPVPLFLSKESSITIFDHLPGAEWNQERKEMDMENVLNQLMTKMNEQGQQSSGLKDTVELYKSRSEWIQRESKYARTNSSAQLMSWKALATN